MMQWLLCASLMFGINEETFLTLEDQYQDQAILEEYDDYTLYMSTDQLRLTYQELILYEWSTQQQVSLKYVDHVLFVSYLDGTIIHLLKLEEGILVKDIRFDQGTFTKQQLFIADSIYIFGGVRGSQPPFIRNAYHQQTDAFLIKLDFDFQILATKIIGGGLNEWFTGLFIDEAQLYLWGYKDTLTGGDFSNAGHENGCSFLITFDWEQNNTKEFYLADESITSVTKEEEILLLLTDRGLYRLDSSLRVLHTFKFALQSCFEMVMSNQLVLIITPLEVKIFSTVLFNLVYETSLKHSFSTIIHAHNKIMMVDGDLFYELKLYDLRLFKNITTNDEVNLQKVYGIDSILELHHYTYLTPYQATVWGRYDVIYDFGEMNISGEVEVAFQTNILDHRIYPVGYQLEFTGVGYLDGNLIVNHHMVTAIGPHTLKLMSINGEEQIIEFEIDREQLPIIDCYHQTIDLTSEINQPFVLPLIIHLPLGVVLDEIILNDQAVPFEVDENEIRVNCSESVAGYYQYCIQRMQFSSGDRTWSQTMELKFYVLVRQESPIVSINFVETHEEIESHLTIQDEEQQLRGILFRLESDAGIREVLTTIKDQPLILHDLQAGCNYHVQVALAYDDGGNELMKVTLFDFTFRATSLTQSVGQVLMLQRGASIEKMSIHLVKSASLDQINMNGELLYFHQELSYGWYVLFGLLGAITSCMIVHYIKIRRQKTNR